jgi:broad specificity phosphatase PhoE
MTSTEPADPTRIVLIRHGESACNVAGIVGGHLGCTGLSPEGHSQARSLRDRLFETGELESATALYSSVLLRAVETAQTISPAVGGGRLEIRQTCELCELHPGESDGMSWQEYEKRYGQPELFNNPTRQLSPGGECWQEFVSRVSETIRVIADRHPGQLVVIAAHGGVIEASMVSFLPFAEQLRPMRLPTAYTSLSEWELGDNDWRLLRYNDVAHLGGPFEAQKTGPHRARRGSGVATAPAGPRTQQE